MQIKPLFAALAAAALAFPIAATAGVTEKPAAAESAPAQTATTSGSNDGGAEAMFTSMDKNADGFIAKDEATSTPHAADFASLDKDGDGKLSRAEHANAKEHVAAREKAGSTGSTASTASATSGKKTY